MEKQEITLSRNHTHATAFTLLEVAIAVTLMAMLMAAAALNVRSYHARQQLEYSARQVQLRFNELRQKAVRTERTCQLKVDWKNNRLLWSQMKPEQDPAGELDSAWTPYEVLYEVEDPVTLEREAGGVSSDREALDGVYLFADGRCTPATYRFAHSRTGEKVSVALVDWSGEARIIP